MTPPPYSTPHPPPSLLRVSNNEYLFFYNFVVKIFIYNIALHNMDFGVLQKSSKHFLIFIFFPPPLGTSGIDQLVPIFHNFLVTNKFCQYLYTIHQILDPPLTRSSLTLFSFYYFAEKNCLLDFWKKNCLPLSGEKKIPSPCLVKKKILSCLVIKKILSPCLVGKKILSPQGKTIAPP